MKEDIKNTFHNNGLYKCWNFDAYKYIPNDYEKDIQVIIPGNFIIIDHFLSSEECDRIVSLAEKIGFKEATVSTFAHSYQTMKNINDRECIINDLQASNIIFDRIQNILPYFNEGGILSSINERFRILKYNEGGKLKFHNDVLFPRIHNQYSERSVFTLHIYLNDVVKGGETIFYHNKWFTSEGLKCVPRKGRIAIFRQTDFDHCGAVVESGLKYIMRSDIMYRKMDENLFPRNDCQICKSFYQFYQCNGHVFPYCKCSNTLSNSYYCNTCSQLVSTLNTLIR
jgi:prolyl 4-hydroxylase